MSFVLCLWLLAGGFLVREAAGSYVGMQRSGFIGIARLMATGLLSYAVVRQKIFSTVPAPAETRHLEPSCTQ